MSNNPDGVQEKKEAEKVERFLSLPAYEQLCFWRVYFDDYEQFLHEYIMDNEHMTIHWNEIAVSAYDINEYADEDIVTHWNEEREIV